MAFVALALISWIVSSALAPDSALPCNFLYGGILALANIQGEMDYNFYPMYGEKYGPFGKGDSAFFFESVGWIEKSDEDFQLVLGGYIPYGEQGAGNEVNEFWQKKESGEDIIAEVDEVSGYLTGYQPAAELADGFMESEYYPGFTWEIDAGKCFYGKSSMNMTSYFILQVNIHQSQKGKSYLVLKDHESRHSYRILRSETEDGWYGTVYLQAIPTAYYSIGIENASSETIVYEGGYGMYRISPNF